MVCTLQVVQNCLGTPNPKFTLKCCLLTWLDCYPKMGKHSFLFNIFKSCTWSNKCSWVCFKAKIEEKRNFILFDKVHFCVCLFWWTNKFIKKSNFLFGDFLCSKRKAFLQIQKIYSFLRFLWFFECENLAAQAPHDCSFS